MDSIVLELQRDVSDSNCDVVNVLRKAHVIASKLKLIDFDVWIKNELNGYALVNDVPSYRIIRGELKGFNPYRGWLPAVISDAKLETAICENPIRESISEIISFCNSSDNTLRLSISGERQQHLNKMFNYETEYTIELQKARLYDIVEKVKTLILDWTLSLESEGILGEGMRFANLEIEAAKELPSQINIYYGTVVNGNPVNSVITNEYESNFHYDLFIKSLREISNSIDRQDVGNTIKDGCDAIVEDMIDKAKAKKNPVILKAAMLGLKDFVISAGATVTAEMIITALQNLF